MKKKLFISIIAGATLLCSMPSCLDLDEKVYDKITVDSFGKTDAEINAIIGPVYSTLNRYFPHNYLYLSESTGDMSITPTRKGGDWYDTGVHRDFHMHTWTANTGDLGSAWDAATQSIAACNLVYETVSNSTLAEEAKQRALAEIRGVRAFWIYVMMDNWGNIPLATDFQEKGLPVQKSRKEVYDFILSELNDIKDKVRDDVSLASYGKFTKGTAYTLLAKMYLNTEAWGIDSPKWKETADACDVVMNLGYIIEPVWKTNFQVQNESSKEAIFAICFSTQDKDNKNQLHHRTLHYKDNITLGGTWKAWNGICAQADYVKLFDKSDKRLEESFLLGEMKDPKTGEVLITVHERPLIHTIEVTQIPGSEYAGSTWGQVNQEDGARCYKWPFDRNTLDAMENDFHIFRLADVYLMKAEALVRMGGDIGEATRLVNIIRERGFGNADHNYSTVTLKEIELERKLELAWECYARQDNIRFGTYQNARYLKVDTKGKDYLNLFAIPLRAWETNNTIKQNTGYQAF